MGDRSEFRSFPQLESKADHAYFSKTLLLSEIDRMHSRPKGASSGRLDRDSNERLLLPGKPLSGTFKTVKNRFWSGLLGKSL